MKKNFLIIISLMCLLSGCTANYKINIDKNGIVDESISLGETKERILTYNTNIDYYMSAALDDIENDNTYNSYSLSTSKSDKEYFGTGTKTYLDLENFQKNSIIINEMFESVSITKQENNVKMIMLPKSTFKHFEESTLYSSLLDEVNIEISIPYVVIDSNADKVTGEVYKWNIKKNMPLKTISILFEENNIKKEPVSINTKILIGMASVIIAGGMYIFIRYKRTGI